MREVCNKQVQAVLSPDGVTAHRGLKQRILLALHIDDDATADGTLLDSLPRHIEFLHIMNDELDLGLGLPSCTDVPACREIAAAPMSNFFRRAGFPEALSMLAREGHCAQHSCTCLCACARTHARTRMRARGESEGP